MSTGFGILTRNTKRLNSNLLHKIYYWYYHDRTLVKIRENLNWYAFPTQIEVSIVKKLKVKDVIIDDILRNAILITDYKNMFGFVPILIYEDKLIKKKRFCIPEFNSVDFYIELDPETYQVRMSFVKRNDYLLASTRYDTDMNTGFVYIWPGMAPNFFSDGLKSSLWPSFLEWQKVYQFEENAIRSDSINSNPTIVIEQGSEKELSNTLTAREITQEGDIRGVSLEQNYRERMDYHTVTRLDNAIENSIVSTRLPAKTREKFSLYDNVLKEERISGPWEGNITLLPYGTKMSKPASASSLKTEDEKKRILENDILQALGLPPSLLQGIGHSNKYTSQSWTEMEKKQLTNTIDKIRKQFEDCFLYILKIAKYFEAEPQLELIKDKALTELEYRKNYVNQKIEDSENIDLQGYLTLKLEILSQITEFQNFYQKIKNLENIEFEYYSQNDIQERTIDEISFAYNWGCITKKEFIILIRKIIGIKNLNSFSDQSAPNELVTKDPPIIQQQKMELQMKLRKQQQSTSKSTGEKKPKKNKTAPTKSDSEHKPKKLKKE